jgi:excisionase family DNA binding protein
MTEDQVLTIKEVAEILKLAEKTVYSMAQDGELPAFKVRGQWRIRKVDFDHWMAEQAKPATARSRKGRK